MIATQPVPLLLLSYQHRDQQQKHCRFHGSAAGLVHPGQQPVSLHEEVKRRQRQGERRGEWIRERGRRTQARSGWREQERGGESEGEMHGAEQLQRRQMALINMAIILQLPSMKMQRVAAQHRTIQLRHGEVQVHHNSAEASPCNSHAQAVTPREFPRKETVHAVQKSQATPAPPQC